MKVSFITASLIGAGLLVGSTAIADTLVTGSMRDNTLYNNGFNSNGAGQHFFVGKTLQGDFENLRRGLIAFDVSEIPPCSEIVSVTMTLNMSKTIVGGTPIGAHRTLADWGEGGSVAPGGQGGGTAAQPGDVTWTERFFPGTLWATPGGDFAAAASATTLVGGNGSYSWSGAGMVADVQAWVNGDADNNGWLLLGVESGGATAKRFDTKEEFNPANRPILSVEYNPPGPCPADLVAPFCRVDADDLLAVINAWGPCPGCPEDFVPPIDVVDADDLLFLINNWGDCPPAP